MLILPIVNKNRVLNVKISLRSASKIRSRVKLYDMEESEVLVSNRKFSDSMYKDSREKDAVMKFIRSNSTLRGKKITISTRLRADEPSYDIYEVNVPPKKTNDVLDSLFALAITDLRKELPERSKGRYISLKQVGLDNILTDKKMDMLYNIVSNVRDASRWPKLFEEYELFDIIDTINFLELFDCTVIGSSSINEDVLRDLISALEKLNTKDYNSLNKYYQMALDNKNIYSKLSRAYQLLYNRSYRLIQSVSQKKNHQLIKVNQIGDSYGG